MALDKFSAVWVSFSSMRDFLVCPRLYYLRNIYKDPVSGRKISLMKPPLALGQIVHEVLESLSVLSVEKRFTEPLISKFELVWQKVSGEKGGFHNQAQEKKYQEAGRDIIRRVSKHPGSLKNWRLK